MDTSPVKPGDDDELEPEYDFRSMHDVVRGKYARAFADRVIRLAADVADEFQDEDAVNEALRDYLRRLRKQIGAS
jgi:uncharacterized protein (DUF4415 family)